MKEITVNRKTRESEVNIRLEVGERNPRAKEHLRTGNTFLNHMLEHIAWRSEINLYAQVSMDGFKLEHVRFEDLGIAVGEVFQKAVRELSAEIGAAGFGDGISTLDEGLARVVLSFESRAFLGFRPALRNLPEETEGTLSEDLKAFLEGFVQGGKCTLHVDVLQGENGHHIWESIFRALGQALKACLAENPWRKGITSGVAGKIETKVESSSKDAKE